MNVSSLVPEDVGFTICDFGFVFDSLRAVDPGLDCVFLMSEVPNPKSEIITDDGRAGSLSQMIFAISSGRLFGKL